MPRPKDEHLWQQYELVPNPNDNGSEGGAKKSYVKCKMCDSVPTKPNASRMKFHLLSKHRHVLDEKNQTPKPVAKRQRKMEALPRPTTSVKANRSIQTIKEDRKSIDQVVAHALYVSNLPFSLLDRPEWRDAFSKISGGTYKPPTEHALSGMLLEEAHQNLKDRVTTMTKNMLACAFTFSESPIRDNHSPKLNLIVAAPTSLCVGSFVKDRNQDNYLNIVDAAETQFRTLGLCSYGATKTATQGKTPFFESKVALAIINSPNAVLSACETLVKREIVPFAAGDVCHALHRFANNVAQMFTGLVVKMTTVAGYFHHNDIAAGLLKDCQLRLYKSSYPILGIHRSKFGSITQLASSLLQSRVALQQCSHGIQKVTGNDTANNLPRANLSSSVCDILNDNTFWVDVETLNTIVKFVSRMLNIFREETVPISCVFGTFMIVNRFLKQILPEVLQLLPTTTCFQPISEADKGVGVILRRLEDDYACIQSPIFELAFTMDPAFAILREKVMSEMGSFDSFSRVKMREEIDKALETIANGDQRLEDMLESQLMDAINNGIRKVKPKHRKFHPLTIWQERIECPKELLKVAVRVFRLPACCSSGQRSLKPRSGDDERSRKNVVRSANDKQSFISYNEKQLKHFSSGDSLPFLGPRNSGTWEKIILWENEVLDVGDEDAEANVNWEDSIDCVYDPGYVSVVLKDEEQL